jgi:folate-binding protein YgfZ
MQTPSRELEYGIVNYGAAMDIQRPGVLWLTGDEAIEFLNRLSTNEVSTLTHWQQRTTVLTTEKAKIIDVVTIIHRGADVLLLTSNGNATNVKKWLEKYIIMEDISITDLSSEYASLFFIGPKILPALVRFFQCDFSYQSMESVHQVTFKNDEVMIFADPRWKMPAMRILGNIETITSLWTALSHDLPAEHTFQKLSTNVLEAIRIEMGIPAFGKEISEQVNPLEAGVGEFISFTKGCYIGQEVIARIDTYNKLQKHLTGFIFDITSEQEMLTGKILMNGEEVGWTTSHTWSFKHKKQIALGYLRANAKTTGLQFLSLLSDSNIPIDVVILPF